MSLLTADNQAGHVVVLQVQGKAVNAFQHGGGWLRLHAIQDSVDTSLFKFVQVVDIV